MIVDGRWEQQYNEEEDKRLSTAASKGLLTLKRL